MKRYAFVCIGLSLIVAVGCSKDDDKSSSSNTTAGVTSGTSGTTSGTAGTTSGTAGTTSGTAGTNTNTTPGTTPPVVGGTGVFSDGSAALPGNPSGLDDFTVAAGDVDGDGDVDLVFGTYVGGLSLLRNNTTQFDYEATAFPTLTFECTDVHLADMDGDGDLDAIAGGNRASVMTFVNDGTGTFATGPFAPNTNDCLTYKIAVGDLNGDTYPDVYMANSGQSTPTQGADIVLLNDQAGGLVEASNALPGLTDDTLGAALADVDNDGDLDVMAVNFAGSHVLLLNDGNANFTDASANLPAALTGDGATAVAAADMNGDGFADFYIVNEGISAQGAADVYLLNDGTGRFNDASILLPTNTDVGFNVRLVDVNGDQAPDAIVANLRGVQRLYLNNSGAFTDATSNYPALNASASNSAGVAVADFNGDRALDIVYAQRGADPWLLLGTPR